MLWTFHVPRRRYTSLYDRPDCPKPKKPPMKDCQPLKRPKWKKIKEKKKCIIREKTICISRSDDKLEVKAKKLRKIIPGKCKPQKKKLKDCAPIKRLKKVYVPEPTKCKIRTSNICNKRADDNLIVKKEKLPILKPTDCSKPKPKPMKDIKLTRLKKIKVKQPPRLCVKKPKLCTQRADAYLKPKNKQLPVLKSINCSKPPPRLMKEAAPTLRLKKIDIPEPPKICKVTKKICQKRADEGLKVKTKSLPALIIAECPKPDEKNLKDCQPLKRLPKVKLYDLPKCEIKKKSECLERADQNLKITSKSLPKLVFHEGCKPKPRRMKESKPLKRLNKVPFPEPEKCCLPETVECEEKRADDNLKIKKKQLPKIQASKCQKISKKPMKNVTLPRLKKVTVVEPPKIYPKPKFECLERADSNRKVKQKQLPKLKFQNCPKLKAKPMKNVNLLRLKKVKIEEPKKVCPVKEEECPVRADETTGYQIKKKPLQAVILNHKYNDISFRHFKKSKKKISSPYFKIKRNYHMINRSYSNRVYFNTKKNKNRKSVYIANDLSSSSKECKPKKPLCPPKEPPCSPPKKSLWQRICDYFRARPGCPAPDEWKKKRLREKAEKAAKAAGMYLCECPRYEKRKMTFKKKSSCVPEKKTESCPKFKMPYCNEPVVRSCEKEVKPIECDPPMETPYPSFSEWKREMKARKISECKVADKKAKAMKWKITALNRNNKNKKREKCFSTSCSGLSSTFYTQKEATRIIKELDTELQKTWKYDNNNVIRNRFLVL